MYSRKRIEDIREMESKLGIYRGEFINRPLPITSRDFVPGNSSYFIVFNKETGQLEIKKDKSE